MTISALFLQINHPPQCPDKPRSPQHPAPRLTAISVPPRVPEMAISRYDENHGLAPEPAFHLPVENKEQLRAASVVHQRCRRCRWRTRCHLNEASTTLRYRHSPCCGMAPGKRRELRPGKGRPLVVFFSFTARGQAPGPPAKFWVVRPPT